MSATRQPIACGEHRRKPIMRSADQWSFSSPGLCSFERSWSENGDMVRTRVGSLILCVLFGFVVVFSTATCSVRSVRSAATPARTGATDELRLLQAISHQHQEAVELAKTCLAKTQRAELISFCKDLTADHESTVRQLQSWLSQWYPGSQSNAGAGHGSEQFRAMANKMQSQTGPEFDEGFLRTLRVHHRQGRDLAASCAASAAHADLKDFCAREEQSQAQEVRQTDEWICEWFRDCTGAATRTR